MGLSGSDELDPRHDYIRLISPHGEKYPGSAPENHFVNNKLLGKLTCDLVSDLFF